MKYVYPAIFHNDIDGLWCEFPDLPGCQTMGDDMTDAALNAEEALEGYLASLYDDGREFPKPTDISTVKPGKNCFVSLVTCSLAEKSVRKTLTIPSRLNSLAVAKGINFSQVLQEALIKKLASA